MSLRGKTLFITGASRGIGLAIGLRAARDGANGAIAAKTYREMPYPISPELFWICDGIWRHFFIESDGEDLLMKPPLEFAAVMARL